MDATTHAGHETTAFRYDPEYRWLVVQVEESWAHVRDHYDDALAVGPTIGVVDEDEAEGFACHEPEWIRRSELEQVGPVLFDICRSIPAGVLPADLEQGLRRAVAHAATTEHIDEIVAATRAWWDAGPGK